MAHVVPDAVRTRSQHGRGGPAVVDGGLVDDVLVDLLEAVADSVRVQGQQERADR